jgi:hypothetical protein
VDRLIVMEEFQVEKRESQHDCSDKNDEEDSFKSKELFYGMGKSRGLLHAAPSTLKDNLNADIFGHLDAHELAECTLIGINIDEALVNPQLPAVPRCGSLTIRTLADWNNQPLGRKRYRTGQIHTCAFCNLPDSVADHLYLVEVCPCQANSGFLHGTTKKLEHLFCLDGNAHAGGNG